MDPNPTRTSPMRALFLMPITVLASFRERRLSTNLPALRAGLVRVTNLRRKPLPPNLDIAQGVQARERGSRLPGTREGSPKHLFRLHERFHLTLVLRHSDDRYVMSPDRFQFSLRLLLG